VKNIQPFIDLGWHTVPLQGQLVRKEDGDKTIPQFEKNWKQKYREKMNKNATAIGGVLTGEVSNIIAIDCDNEVTYNLFKSLDPDYETIFISEGKGKEAGTFIYKYDAAIPDSFSPTDGDIELDVYSDNGFVYLPTKDNDSKRTWTTILDIKELPATTKLLLMQLQKKVIKPKETYIQSSQARACLEPILIQFIGKRGEFIPSLFKVITPRDFRQLEQYQTKGFLHPQNVPDGRGSEYLSKISAILGADESVNEELYIDCMTHINDLYNHPMDGERLDTTILSPMLEHNASIDGVPIWQYNEQWADDRFSLTTKHGLIIDVAFDDRRNTYYFIDMTNEILHGFAKDTEFMSYLEATVRTEIPKKRIVKQKTPIVHIQSNPSVPFGFCKSSTPQVLAFNSFKPSAELAIIQEPEDYKKFYKKPEAILKYLECLVPNDDARNYMLRFLKRKFLTFDYSPVILYFLGVPGSGKDTFVSILEEIMSTMSRPTTNEFLEIYNNWMLDTYFVQLDEYGDQLSRMADKEMVKGKLKAYTGKAGVRIRNMRQASYDIRHAITFIMTANKNPLMLDDQDRRVHLMETPNVLEMQPWFNSQMYDQMMSEIKDFCYYLATDVPTMTKDEYMSPPKSESKHRLIADSMFAAQKLAYAFKHSMWNYLIELAKDHGADKFADGIKHGRVASDDLEELYDELTDFKGDCKTVRKILRKEGFAAIPTTKQGHKSYYYNLKINPFEDN